MLRPELCRAHEGIARDLEYAKRNCLIDHIVYLALSPGLKVGVTRSTQIPTRWIDQGADSAVKMAITPNRYQAGLIEVALKEMISDKTNWRQMLSSNENSITDLSEEKWRLEELMPMDLKKFVIDDDEIIRISYPVNQFPLKIKSIDLDKKIILKGNLTGIKGQYLILESGEVMNIRKYGGYSITIEY